MTLPLELGALPDEYTRRALEQVAQQFPLGPTALLGGLPSSTATFPTGTFNGQDFYYLFGGSGGVWHFKYNKTAAKWDFAGGPALYSADMPVRALSTTAYNPPTGNALTAITVPFAGVYRCKVYAEHADINGWGVKTAPRYNGAAADTTLELLSVFGAGNYTGTVAAEYELTLNASSTFTVEHATADATPANSSVLRRSISIEPVRVS